MSEPAYLKYTDRVRRGIAYAIAALEFDARYDLIDPERGGQLQGATSSEDLQAAAAYLKYQQRKQGERNGQE